jgi:hypothetical protein
VTHAIASLFGILRFLRRVDRLPVASALLGLALALCPGCAADSGSEDVLARISGLVGDPGIFDVDPSNVVQRVEPIAALHAEAPSQYLRRFSGKGDDPTVVSVVAEFQPGASDAEDWELLQLRIELVPPDGDFERLFDELSKRISAKLGPARDERMEADSKRRAWSPAAFREVALLAGSLTPAPGERRAVVIEVAVLQGEEE